MELPKRKPNRLPDYDYSSPSAYFITICTKQRKNILGSVGATDGRPHEISLSPCGKIVDSCIKNIPEYYPVISLDQYVVMPNHIHLLLQIHSGPDGRPVVAPTMSQVVNQLKGAASKKAGFSLWQKGFHDHVIRGDADYLEIWNYIQNNPATWEKDKLFMKE